MAIKKKTFFLHLTLILGVLLAASALSKTWVSPARAGNLVFNSDFSNGESWPWTTSETWQAEITGVIENGEFCVTPTHLAEKGELGSLNSYDVQVRQRRLAIEKGHTYTARFTAYAKTESDGEFRVRAVVQDGHPGYHNYLGKTNNPTGSVEIANGNAVFPITKNRPAEPYFFSFTLNEAGDPAAELNFQLGYPENENVTICFDDITLENPQYTPPVENLPATSPVRVNQVGYFVNGPKRASVVVSSMPEAPIPWELKDSDGTRLYYGDTIPFGMDGTSGDFIHIIDFSDYTTAGTNLKLVVGYRGNYTSHPFDIRDDLYSQMKFDALSYFYQNRSGTAIEAQYVGNTYARGAGPDDSEVPCFTGLGMDHTDEAQTEHTEWANCNGLGLNYIYPDGYYVNAYKGWYDAGDHGKYVVNGGISVWTLLNLYERSQYLGDGRYASVDPQIFMLGIPEQGNKVPDILDEARWEIEFMRSMRIKDYRPGGDPRLNPAGLVHHMLHDTAWSDIPNRPDEVAANVSGYERAVYPPSLAATFNFAAVAAQASRIWEGIDSKYAATLYKEAEGSFLKAYSICSDAHTEEKPYINICEDPFNKNDPGHQEWYAKYSGLLAGAGRFNGGGPYDDDNLSDEFYWAAAELYATTGSPVFLEILQDSPHYLSVPFTLPNSDSGSMDWKNTAALGTISLAIVGNQNGNETVDSGVAERARANLITAADVYRYNISSQGYGTPYAPGNDGYAWGSNSFVLNELIVMGLAYDFTSDDQYLNGMIGGMDYILGRNAMDKSYVSGYGENPLLNPHHRHWGHQGWPIAKYPYPPAGAVSGGPYSGLELNINKATSAMGLWANCHLTPQKCYVDDIDAYAVNEITINWNAPFAWATAYLDEKFNPIAAHQVVQPNVIFLPCIQVSGNR